MPNRKSALSAPLAFCALWCSLPVPIAARAEAAAAAGFKYWDVEDTSKVPRSLSATGIYADIKAGKLIDAANPFEVNTPLWSDGAHKKRWVLLKPGRSIAFAEKDDYWGYPDSTVFIKQFVLDSVPGDTSTHRLWETRLLINKKEKVDPATGAVADHWYGFSYQWNAKQTDADWVGVNDSGVSMRTYPGGISKPVKMKKWVFPAGSCVRCHLSGGYGAIVPRSVLGFFTAQLNRPSPVDAKANQLEDLFSKGVLHGTKPADWDKSPRWAAIEDTTASLNLRARSYLGANCSGCHGNRGLANGATGEGCYPNYDYFLLNDSLMDFRHAYSYDFFGMSDSLPQFYPATDKGNNPKGWSDLEIQPELIVPGYPQKSAIYMRQRAKNTKPGDYDGTGDQMPPYGTFEVNEPAMAVLAAWIKAMPRMPAPGWDVVPPPPPVSLMNLYHAAGSLSLDDRVLKIPPGIAPGTAVTMTGFNGRTVSLHSLGQNAYAVPAGLPRGIYIVRIGQQAFRRVLR